MKRSTTLRAYTAALTLTTMLTGVAVEALAQIEEIVVTTRKREENLQEVPIVVTAFTAESIQQKGITDLADVAKYTSGMMFDQGFGKQDTRIVLRGLSPTRGRQNVAILQDEVDISSLAQSSAGGSFVINPRLTDVQRIEVVKGPHPALFGRSAFSGAINYISKRPGDEFEGNAQVDVGTYDKYEARVGVSGPVSDKLSLGLNASAWTFGGFYDSAVTGNGLGGGDGWGTAFSANLEASDNLTFFSRTEYSKDNFDPEARFGKRPAETPLPPQVFQAANGLPAILNGAVATNLTFPQSFGSLGHADDYAQPAPSRNPRTGEDYPGSNRKIFRTTLRSEWEGDSVDFTSITHYGNNDTFQFNDAHGLGDFASTAINGGQETYFDTNTRLFSQEFRLQSSGENTLDWTVGALYWNERLDQHSRSIVCVAASGGCAPIFAALTGFATPENRTKRDTFHYSGYGLAEYAVTDRLKASVELRYTVEEEDTSGFSNSGPNTTPTAANPTIGSFYGCPGALPSRVLNANGTLSCATAGPLVTATTNPLRSIGFTQVEVGSVFWVPRFTIDYKATDDALIYATAGMGKKPGGLGTVQNSFGNLGANIYDPEEMWTYEVGAKTTWLDGQLQLNGAAYYQDYSKKQVSVTFETTVAPFITTRVVNAGAASVKGFELDALYAPTEFVTFNASYTYNDGEYDEFTDITTTASVISRASVRNGGNCTVVAIGGANRCRVDYAGYDLEGSSKHSLQAGVGLTGDISADFGWFANTDVRYQSSRYTTFENALKMEAYWLVDLRGGVKSEDWSITAYVNNLFNDDTLKSTAVYLQAWNVAYQPPRATALPSFASGVLPDKRQFGVRASMDF